MVLVAALDSYAQPAGGKGIREQGTKTTVS